MHKIPDEAPRWICKDHHLALLETQLYLHSIRQSSPIKEPDISVKFYF